MFTIFRQGGLLEHLVSQPEYKLLGVRSIPLMSDKSIQFSTYEWHGLLKHLTQMLIADAPMEEGTPIRNGLCSEEGHVIAFFLCPSGYFHSALSPNYTITL